MNTVGSQAHAQPTLFGHPTGLFTLFFAEMWERFSFYGMRALLVFYMIKGFLGYTDEQAYGVYGAYTALVYASPFIGGILADRLLGARRAVIIGGLLMAAGHLLMTVEHSLAFFCALSLLVCGNGFFKPNISTIVGELYPPGSGRRDAGFTIFYMGVNLGAAMAPIICGYIGEVYGWHYGFGLATAGMLIGVAVFAAPTHVTQILIVAGAGTSALAMPFFQDSAIQLVVRLCLSAVLVAACAIAVVALHRGGVPSEAGRHNDPTRVRRKLGGVIRADVAVYVGILAAVPFVALLLQRNDLAGAVLFITGGVALAYILYDAIFRCSLIERQRVYVILILMVFVLLFWAFFEQAGSSVNNFTDRNVDRVLEDRHATADDVGSTIRFRVPAAPAEASLAGLPLLTQEQLGYPHGGDVFTMSDLTALRERASAEGASADAAVVAWPVRSEHVGMGVGGAEIPASEFQAVNPIYILIFGLVFTALWSYLGRRGMEPSTPVKFALGLLQLGLGFAAMWYGVRGANDRGMVEVGWLLLGYLLHTTGELCLSPVGLSMVTRLSPGRIVSTMMGAWFLATAFSQFLAGQIAKLTAVAHEGGEQFIPPPTVTVGVYGQVFGQIAVAAVVSAAVCFAMSPLLTRWMHEGRDETLAADHRA